MSPPKCCSEKFLAARALMRAERAAMNGSSKTLYGKPARRIACKAQTISAISFLLIVELRRSAAELHRGVEPFPAPPVRFEMRWPKAPARAWERSQWRGGNDEGEALSPRRWRA